MPINEDQYRSIPLNKDQCRSMLDQSMLYNNIDTACPVLSGDRYNITDLTEVCACAFKSRSIFYFGIRIISEYFVEGPCHYHTMTSYLIMAFFHLLPYYPVYTYLFFTTP